MHVPLPPSDPYIAVFRNRFEVAKKCELQLTFSGDECCQLRLDRQFLADGPERSTRQRWKKACARTELLPGKHVLTAEVLCFGNTLAVHGQLSIRHGFFCEEQSSVLGTWECCVVPRLHFRNADPQYGTTLRHVCELWNYAEAQDGMGDNWNAPVFFEDERVLFEPELPTLSREKITTFHRHDQVFVFSEYVCVHTEIEFSGRGTAEIRWAEPGCSEDAFSPAFLNACEPGRSRPFLTEVRPDILDVYPPDGRNMFWRPFSVDSGRLMEIRTIGSLRVENATFYRANYPHPMVDFPKQDDPRRQQLLEKSWRTLQACTWETFMDCPYYERMQYIGDTRIQALVLATVSTDLRLVEKALRDFADSQYSDGTLPCRYPSKDSEPAHYDSDGSRCCHVIPGFEAIYIQMVHDYARLRRNDTLVRDLLPTIRRQIGHFLEHRSADGLIRLPGWNFVDWLAEYGWKNGCPPHGENGGGATLTWLLVLALQNAAELEHLFGDPVHEKRAEEAAVELKSAARKIFFDPKRGCYAEDEQHTVFSEHANVIAMLTEPHPELIPAMTSGTLIPAGIYFSFYVLEACTLYGMTDLYRSREELYLKTADSPLSTMPEVFFTGQWQRSNCHAWSSHMIYHMLKTDSFTGKIPVDNNSLRQRGNKE